MSSSNDALDPSALVSALPKYLPPSSKSLTSPQDAIAALVHTAFSILGFRLVGVTDHDTSAVTFEGNVLPLEWNQHGPGNHTFKYKHDQSSLEFVVKISKLGSRTIINAIALETDKASTLDISTTDFTSESFFPWSASDAEKPLIHGFISSNRVTDFTFELRMKIIQKLIPGLRKEGYTETDDTSTNASSSAAAPRSQQPPSTSQPRPHDPYSPLIDRDPLALPPHRSPLEIGRRDLDPIPNAPRMPRNAFAPPSMFPGQGPDLGGDGMFVGPDHPIFGARRGGPLAGEPGPWGGDGFLPPMGAPPGARFDPVGPTGLGGLGPFPPPGGRAPRRYGDPDNDEFMPPGMGDMYM